MIERLIEHICRLSPTGPEALEQAAATFSQLELPKKHLLVAEGGKCTQLYFVAKGSLRLFYLDDKGVEQTIQFAIENWWMTDIDAFNRGSKASFSIQTVERSTLLAITKPDWDQLLRQQPELETYFRIVYERAYAASLFRMKFFRLSKDAFYELFHSKYPDIVQRIPQKLLASFLGFTPEYLSELRKKKLNP